MDALMQSFCTGFGYVLGGLMGLTIWITFLRLVHPTKKPKWPPPLPPTDKPVGG